ncbi:putative hydrolase of the HAD superfamily [Natranaerovirga pectinivora]|uniref:Putative hydrolase of the HAD superfamily n=1 Tax=Natranaerovirga pectinivora TaxID=682400 RepID=A0A4R3MKP8_9FIRM|nr:HAD-IA family hydrolase [Natranaerovirga pectinivora]TCT14035.1 putative hydrolase of the HAD superfamily [Natranaerovirga pectinivora]
MKAVIFDLDDTLYNEKQFVYGAFYEVAEYLGCKYDLTPAVLYQEMINEFRINGRGKVFNKICYKYKFKEDINVLVEIYRRAKPPLKLYEDGKKFIQSSRGRYRLGLITDGLHYVQWNKIKTLGIESLFDAIIVTDDLGKEYWKPSKVPYIKIAEELNVSFKDMVYIGDNPNKDFYSAKELGMLTIRIIREDGDYKDIFLEKEYEANYMVKDLFDLEKFFIKE